MLEFFKNLFARAPKPNIDALIARGAIIVDVRTEREFKAGHVKGSVNIPLDRLPQNLSKLNKSQPIITCCASGMRSATAKKILENNGFAEVYNAGGWTNIKI